MRYPSSTTHHVTIIHYHHRRQTIHRTPIQQCHVHQRSEDLDTRLPPFEHLRPMSVTATLQTGILVHYAADLASTPVVLSASSMHFCQIHVWHRISCRGHSQFFPCSCPREMVDRLQHLILDPTGMCRGGCAVPVSYTHLTLPTKRIV